MKDGNVSGVRANFLISFEAAFGRGKTVVTRQELLDFQSTWGPGQKGGTGLVLRFPSWLTNPANNPYKISRGTFSVPWSILDEYNVLMSGKTQMVAGSVAPAEPTAVEVSVVAVNS